MDGTPQTIAEAVQAATQQAAQQAQQAQQQQQLHLAHPSPPVQQSQTSAIDNLTCQWQGCGERTDSAESLYDHVCERHVGRKSTNNLNLTCQWGACRTTTVKRDHITSHIRVHVPLKPHKCDFCGKAFKRPQDLKKHVKTHADDSVLANSPMQGHAGRHGMVNSGGMGQSKTNGYYGDMHNHYPSYQPAMSSGQNGGGFAPVSNNQYAGYGSVSYPNHQAGADLQSLDTRRRAIEALNDFLGDIKRRAINPSTYYDVGHRLQGNALPPPIGSGTGYNLGYNSSGNNNSGSGNYGGMSTASLLESFNHAHDMSSGLQGGGVATHAYSLPMPNARTKNDLQDIDRFLEQLQATVYETSNNAAASGVQQAGVHSQFTGEYGFGNNGNSNTNRSSNSPTSYSQSYNSNNSSFGAIDTGSNNMPTSTSALDTPALTPSSISSYASSGHSPMSSHSRASLGSLSGNGMYPNLPSVTGMSDLGSGYPATTSAPASGLASGFSDGLDGRRHSGGYLTRANPATPSADTEMPDVDDGSRTPKASEQKSTPEIKEPETKEPENKNNDSIDPALRAAEAKSESSTPAPRSEGEDKRQEDWVENIRTIEALRKWIGERLRTGDYEEEGDLSAPSEVKPGDDEAAAKMAETAKMAEAKMVEEKMADVAAALKEGVVSNDHEIKYPLLPSV
ncbi:Hypothetical protein R9X50_00129000 [Acrodontium crateriforme]|uniref:C2H2-type domain-containing protein n=1 Tax=Acrodontium crateriforme TaxID=150365 RepID=A0AAQ3R813_9PEZI|nr:Hypothetical protein R9X50_00129000 [Acrodontium crateriforme]